MRRLALLLSFAMMGLPAAVSAQQYQYPPAPPMNTPSQSPNYTPPTQPQSTPAPPNQPSTQSKPSQPTQAAPTPVPTPAGPLASTGPHNPLIDLGGLIAIAYFAYLYRRSRISFKAVSFGR